MWNPGGCAEPDIAAQVNQLIPELSSDRFETRQAAEMALQRLGSDAFKPLLDVVDQVRNDSAQSILRVVEHIWLACPAEAADSLERQLYERAWQFGPHQSAFDTILSRHVDLRQARAIRALRRLNVIVRMEDDDRLIELELEASGKVPEVRPQRIRQIAIPTSWKGGDSDLWHFHRLSITGENLSDTVPAFYVRGVLSPEQMLTIVSRAPSLLHLTERSPVYLGVLQDQFVRESVVGSVEPGSSAEKAGIQPGDQILLIDEIPISNFSDLINALKTKRPYEEFITTVDRHGVLLKLPVIGLPWENGRFETPPEPPHAELLIPGLTPKFRNSPDYLPPPEIKP